MSLSKGLGLLVCLGALVSPTLSAAQEQLLITEFLAANSGPLLDENGEASDWIEIYNAGTAPVNLAGWRLTDDAANLGKWSFPATNLAAGNHLLVFASGKNRAVTGQQLHTSFALDNAGEYLALVKPDGVTIAQQFAPVFPPQINGVSYGVAVSVATSVFVTNGNSARWRVPLNIGMMPADWAATNFNDAAWSAGGIGLGYGGGLTNTFTGPTNNVALGKATTQSSTNNTFSADLAVNGNYADYTHTLVNVNLPATWEVNLATNFGISSIVLYNRNSNQSRLRDITVQILSLGGLTTNYTSALLNPENVLGGSALNVGPATLSLNLPQLTGGLVLGGRVRVIRTPDPDLSGSGGGGSTSEPNVLSLAEVEVFGVTTTTTTNGAFGGVYQTDIGGAMKNINSTALLRVPFLIPEDEMPVLDSLTLSVQYADGFVAYLNGQEIARRNSPTSPTWNSAAVTNRATAAALVAENINVSAFINLLQEGTNILAVHGLNSTASAADFLLAPQLIGRKVNLTPDRYYVTPTPGTTNSGGALGVVADTKFSVDRGLFTGPFSLSITSATENATIRFTTNGELPSAVSGIIYTGPILLNKTTPVRAIATKPGWLPSDVDTHTYVFLANVLTQSLTSATSSGFPTTWAGTTPDYAMDATVVNANLAALTNGLRALPSVFVTSSISNLFDATTGIYTHPLSSGAAWERAISVEMIGTNGATEFQENAGLRIQGGVFFRDFSMTQKKSFRVLFKSTYGVGRLQHDLFHEPGAAEAFDGFVLRAGANDGYAWDGAGATVQFTRDEFGRRLNLAMGQPAPRGMFVHLYLNGCYWGMYNLVERPNEDFSSTYLGGEPEEWDACAAGDFKNGGTAAVNRWNDFINQASAVTTYAGYQAMQGNNADGSRNPALPRYFDPANYQDYMIANLWGGNWDWPNKNFWFGYHTNAASTGYKFFMWDFENTMGNSRDRSPLTMVSPRPEVANQWVGLPHYHLKDYADYQVEFGDRVQKYFFNGGLLTPQELTNRYLAIANMVQPAIVAESARWGDDNRTPAYGLNEWLVERNWILTNYLPQRSAIVLNQFRSSALFPTLGAPTFNQWGGAVTSGFNLVITHTNVAGSIFYTLDGSDPRQPGTGAVGTGALAYSGPIVVNAPTYIRARVRNGSTWSAIVAATFYPPQDLSKLTLTEIMYHAPDIGATNGNEFDFLELKNTGTNTLNLSGLAFTTGVTFTFTNGTTLAPGAFCVLARNAAAFAAKYPTVSLKGIFTGSLDNGGETLTLSHPLGTTIFSVNYDDALPWPIAADGFGFSLVQKNPNQSQAPDDGNKWRASTAIGGSPGVNDPATPLAPIVINEVLAHTDPPLYDAIELFNPTATNVNVGGWYLTDDAALPLKFRIPNNTIIAAGGYLYFDANQFNATPGSSNSFALSSVGDDVYLFSADLAGNLTGYSHGVAFGASFNGVSFGRYVNSAGEEFFPLQTARTLGAANADPRIGPIIISEINYNPALGGDEFIELLNITASPVPLYDPAFPTNTWKVNGIGFTFPTNLTLPAGQTLLLVATNPASFRAKYGVSNSVVILGPYSGVLDNSGENLELQQPDAPNTNEVPYVTVEAVRYNDKLPWSPGADGTGLSLQRAFALSYGNEPLNWNAAAPTPSQAFGSGDTDGDGLPDAWEIANGTLVNVVDVNEDPDGDGMTNWQEFLAGTHPNNAADVLQVLAVNAAPTGFQLSFQAASNRTYTVLTRASLSVGSWTKLVDVPAATTNRMMTVTDPATDASRFYRLVTPALP